MVTHNTAEEHVFYITYEKISIPENSLQGKDLAIKLTPENKNSLFLYNLKYHQCDSTHLPLALSSANSTKFTPSQFTSLKQSLPLWFSNKTL
jgi:hypothetical protein